MKPLMIAFGFWILIVPSLVASFLLIAAIAAVVPALFLVTAWFGAAFTAAALLCGPFWTPPNLHPSLLPSAYSVAKLIRGEKQ